MRSIAAFIIHVSSFISKELVEIFRQPRLILALILGPFAILLLFGLGYRNEARVLRTVFVVPVSEAAAKAQIEEYAKNIGPQLSYQGITTDQAQALRQLASGQVDVVAVIPDQIEAKIRSSEQPTVTLYHREIDPLQANYINYFAQIYVGEINRRILVSSAAQGQQQVADVQKYLATAKASAHAMRLAYEQKDAVGARQQQQQTQKSMDAVSLGLGATLGLLQGVEKIMGTNSGASTDNSSDPAQILGTISDINSNNESLAKTDTNKQEYSAEAQQSAKIETDLDKLDKQVTDFRQIDPHVLISPFKGESKNVTGLVLTSSDFFSPGVIILLLQHLAVTFAALSIVRERMSGTMELFRVSPVSAFEVLIGKYISYMLLGSVLAAAISALVVLVLHVPMLGSWSHFAILLLAVLFASLGFGFVISLVSENTSQAVQYSMLMLLLTIFFSGFFLDLRLMQPTIRILSWILPATYGMQLIQETMFRAAAINWPILGGLLGIGVFFFFSSWLLLRHQMKLN